MPTHTGNTSHNACKEGEEEKNQALLLKKGKKNHTQRGGEHQCRLGKKKKKKKKYTHFTHRKELQSLEQQRESL